MSFLWFFFTFHLKKQFSIKMLSRNPIHSISKASFIHETDVLGNDVVFSRQIGEYQYIRTLGRGTFSIVALVYEPTQKKSYACKISSRKQLVDKGILKRFEQEVRIQQNLHHDGIVKIYDIVYAKDIIAVIMEYCRNGDLYQYIVNHGILPDPLIQSIFQKTINALSYIHSRGIAHRDIKPENILLDENFNPKIADFGLCHLLTDPKLLLSTSCGSPFYCAPEIISGLQYDGLKADIWSLGVVLFAMATASLPWNKTTELSLFHQIESSQIEIPSFISPPIQYLLKLMLDKNPDTRASVTDILQFPWLQEVSEHSEILPTTLKRATPHRRNHIGSCDDALNQLRNKKSFVSSPHRNLIIRPDLPSSNPEREIKELNPMIKTLTRRVPPRVIIRRPLNAD